MLLGDGGYEVFTQPRMITRMDEGIHALHGYTLEAPGALGVEP